MQSREKIADLVQAKIGEQACSIERVYFVKTDRMHNPQKIYPFKYFPGSQPVLVSAPHSVRHIRHKKIKPSDEFTGSIAAILNNLTGCHSLSVAKLYGGDPNFDDDCLYKETVKTLCHGNGIALVIDLHGASREHWFDIDIGNINGSSLLGKTEFTRKLKNSFTDYGITQISENHFTVSGQRTVTSYVSEIIGIPAIQLEINKKFRVPHQNAAEYCRLIGALTNFISGL